MIYFAPKHSSGRMFGRSPKKDKKAKTPKAKNFSINTFQNLTKEFPKSLNLYSEAKRYPTPENKTNAIDSLSDELQKWMEFRENNLPDLTEQRIRVVDKTIKEIQSMIKELLGV